MANANTVQVDAKEYNAYMEWTENQDSKKLKNDGKKHANKVIIAKYQKEWEAARDAYISEHSS